MARTGFQERRNEEAGEALHEMMGKRRNEEAGEALHEMMGKGISGCLRFL
jgi:hypothetical protein